MVDRRHASKLLVKQTKIIMISTLSKNWTQKLTYKSTVMVLTNPL